MYKKELSILVIALILIVPLFFYFGFRPESLTNNAIIAEKDPVNKNYSDSYDINIIHTNNSAGKRKIYKAISKPIDSSAAKTYAGLFGLKNYSEDETGYFFTSETESLNVFKDGSRLVYTNSKKNSGFDEKINEQQAKSISESFIKDKMLPLDYNICEITHSQTSSVYKVRFINTIEGIKNYAFPKTVEIDEYGNINYILYYNYAYRPSGQINVISQSKAVDILLGTKPSETGVSGKIDIKYQELVYNANVAGDIYPYYRFCGQTGGKKGYECFISSFTEE